MSKGTIIISSYDGLGSSVSLLVDDNIVRAPKELTKMVDRQDYWYGVLGGYETKAEAIITKIRESGYNVVLCENGSLDFFKASE